MWGGELTVAPAYVCMQAPHGGRGERVMCTSRGSGRTRRMWACRAAHEWLERNRLVIKLLVMGLQRPIKPGPPSGTQHARGMGNCRLEGATKNPLRPTWWVRSTQVKQFRSSVAPTRPRGGLCSRQNGSADQQVETSNSQLPTTIIRCFLTWFGRLGGRGRARLDRRGPPWDRQSLGSDRMNPK